jgi:hypothetical protein
VLSPQSAPAELLAALAAAFSDMRAPWHVFGAHAAMVWGRPRLTADIDVTVRQDPDNPERLVRTLEARGFACDQRWRCSKTPSPSVTSCPRSNAN